MKCKRLLKLEVAGVREIEVRSKDLQVKTQLVVWIFILR